MGWLGRGLLSIYSSKGGNPHLSQLRTDCLAPVSKFNYILAHTIFMGSRKLSSSVCHRVRRYLTSLWMLYGIVSGQPRSVHRGIRMEDGTKVWTLSDFLITS
jgi:hypothetical protein